MTNQRLTLRITRATDVALVTEKLERALSEQGVANSSLSELLFDTAQRFHSQLVAPNTLSADGASAKQNSASTVIRGEGYSIVITTQEATGWSRFVDWLLRRPAAFS